MNHSPLKALLLLLFVTPLSAQTYLSDYLPDYELNRESLISSDGLSFYTGLDHSLYYWNPDEEIILSDSLGEMGILYEEGDVRSGLCWQGSFFRGYGVLPYVENIDLVLDEDEMDISSQEFYNGINGWLTTPHYGVTFQILDFKAYGSAYTILPLSGGVYLNISGSYSPLLMLKASLLEETDFPLILCNQDFILGSGWQNDWLDINLNYSWNNITSQKVEPENDGIWLNFDGESNYRILLNGELQLRSFYLRFAVETSEYELSASGKLYDFDDDGSSNYDIFLTIEEENPLSLQYHKLQSSLSFDNSFTCGFFLEGIILPEAEDRQIYLNAPSTIVSTNFVYRYFMDQNSLTYYQGGLFAGGQLSWGIFGLGMDVSVSYTGVSAGTTAKEVAGIFIPFVSVPDTHELGELTMSEEMILYRLGLDFTVSWEQITLIVEVDQLIPQVLNQEESLSGGESSSESLTVSDFVWGGFDFFCGLAWKL